MNDVHKEVVAIVLSRFCFKSKHMTIDNEVVGMTIAMIYFNACRIIHLK